MRKLLNVDAAAKYVGVTPQTLHRLRVEGGGPLFIRIKGVRKVIYDRADLDVWLDGGRHQNTSEYDHGAPRGPKPKNGTRARTREAHG